MFTRKAKHIRGSIRRVKRKRGPDAWEFRYQIVREAENYER